MSPEAPLNLPAIAAFVGYLLVIVGIGVYATRFSSAGLSEFFIGGRRMSRFVVALSAVVSGRSAWLLLGVTGMAYTLGVSALWSIVGYVLVELTMFLYYAPRLRRFTESYGCITIPDFFAARFDDRDGRLRGVLVLIILVFMIAYVSAQFVAGGKAMSASFGLNPTTGVLITAVIVLAYTMLGGFLAVSLTDTVQGILMLVALVVLPLVAIAGLGGTGALVAELHAFDPTLLDPLALGVGAMIGYAGIGLGSPGNPHILVRFMSLRDPRQFPFVALVGTVWNVVMASGAILIGLAGRVYFPESSMLPGGDTENLYPVLAGQHLPPLVFGIVLAAIFAAIMSTADSQLLVAASSVVRDIYEKVVRRGEELPQHLLVRYSRALIVLIVGAALGLGVVAEELVFWLVLFAWAGLGSAIGPTSILALYWRSATRVGVIAGAIAGTLTTIVWYYTPALRATIYELIPGFVAGIVATVLVSKLSRPPTDVGEMFAAMDAPVPEPKP